MYIVSKKKLYRFLNLFFKIKIKKNPQQPHGWVFRKANTDENLNGYIKYTHIRVHNKFFCSLMGNILNFLLILFKPWSWSFVCLNCVL